MSKRYYSEDRRLASHAAMTRHTGVDSTDGEVRSHHQDTIESLDYETEQENTWKQEITL